MLGSIAAFGQDYLTDNIAGFIPVGQGQGVPCKGQTFPVLTSLKKVGNHQETSNTEGRPQAGKRSHLFLDRKSRWALAQPSGKGRKALSHWGGQSGFRQGTIPCRNPKLRTLRPVSCVRLQGLKTGSLYYT